MKEIVRISNPEEIKGALSALHDGTISAYLVTDNVLHLTIEIQYLASTLNPGFSKFEIDFFEVGDIEFETWPRDPQAPAIILTNIEEIFVAQLEILDVEFIDEKLTLHCNAKSTDLDYSGGRLTLRCAAVTVTDEAGRSHSSYELQQLSETYWANW